MWGSRSAKHVHWFQLWLMGKLQRLVLWEFLWFEKLSYFVALSSWANTIFRYFQVVNLGWEKGSLISVAERAEVSGWTCTLLHGWLQKLNLSYFWLENGFRRNMWIGLCYMGQGILQVFFDQWLNLITGTKVLSGWQIHLLWTRRCRGMCSLGKQWILVSA